MSRRPGIHRPPAVGARIKRSYKKWYSLDCWRRLREAHLSEHPLCQCEECEAADAVTPATEVDHKIPHRGNWSLFMDPANLQSLSKSHHSKKTARGE